MGNCGNGSCESACSEDCNNCAQDCACPSCQQCVNGSCTTTCGNGTCEPSCAEDCGSCATDCGCGPCDQCVGGTCVGNCGNEVCEPACSENCNNCAEDCACAPGQECVNGECTSDGCPNGTCDGGEDCDTCPSDCACASCERCVSGSCEDMCGNGTCEPTCSETRSTCPDDCACTDDSDCNDNLCEECDNGDCRSECDADAICVNAVCVSDPCAGIVCDNGNLCDGIEVCQNGSCEDGTPIDCEDNDPCTIDTCDANLGCRHTPIDCPPGAPGFTPDPGCGACGNGAGMGMVISLFGWLGLRLTGSRRRAGKCAAKSAVRASKATEYVSHD